MKKTVPFLGIDKFLKEHLDENASQQKLGSIIGVKQAYYSRLKKEKNLLTAKSLHKYIKKIFDYGFSRGKIAGRKENAENFFSAVETVLDINNIDIAKKLIKGKNTNSKTTALSKYRNGIIPVSRPQYKNILGKHSSKIFKPIVEFMECSPYVEGKKWKLFRGSKKLEESIKAKLSKDNGAKVGVYAMYDSSGKILYFGKTNKGLYAEIVQRLNAVVHRDVALVRDGKFVHVGNKSKGGIHVGDMTRYISAIEVLSPEAISNIETFVLRLIPNDDVNYKIENYE